MVGPAFRAGRVDNIQELHAELASAPVRGDGLRVQSAAFLIELSLDWIVCRASENIHHLLGQSHVSVIEEPLGEFVHAQALHDLRNLFSRLSGTTGIGRAYRVRLTDDAALFDIAFQQVGERVILEAVPSPKGRLGEALSAVGGLAAGLSGETGPALLDAAARRMRALTAFDRVTLLVGDRKSTSSRTGVPFKDGANATLGDELPTLIPDCAGESVAMFPHGEGDAATAAALLRAPTADQQRQLAERGFAATMRVPVTLDAKEIGEFRLAHTSARRPTLELHAAAELFAQLFALRLQIDQLKG